MAFRHLKNIYQENFWQQSLIWYFGGAKSKHFHDYIQPTVNEKNVKTDIYVLHFGTNDILNAEGERGLIAESVNVLGCVWKMYLFLV